MSSRWSMGASPDVRPVGSILDEGRLAQLRRVASTAPTRPASPRIARPTARRRRSPRTRRPSCPSRPRWSRRWSRAEARRHLRALARGAATPSCSPHASCDGPFSGFRLRRGCPSPLPPAFRFSSACPGPAPRPRCGLLAHSHTSFVAHSSFTVDSRCRISRAVHQWQCRPVAVLLVRRGGRGLNRDTHCDTLSVCGVVYGSWYPFPRVVVSDDLCPPPPFPFLFALSPRARSVFFITASCLVVCPCV